MKLQRLLWVWLCPCLVFGASRLDAQVSGTVVDAGSGLPIANARVTLQGTTTQTTTDATGSFTLAATGTDLVVVAAFKGYFYSNVLVNSPAVGVVFEMDEVPIEFDPNYDWDPNSFCSFCHGDQQNQWEQSRMGNTGRNTWVYDLFSGNGTAGGAGGFVYQTDAANLASDPDGNCAACHQPVAWLRGGTNVPLSQAFDNPSLPLESTSLTDPDAELSVPCDMCHKVADVNTANVNTFGPDPTAVTLSLPVNFGAQRQYGVLGDVSFEDFLMNGSYQPQLTHDVCAACHQYFNDIDQNGVNDNLPGQTTWSEWANSPYGDELSPMYETCVSCHATGFGADQACGIPMIPAPNRDPATVHEMMFKGTDATHLENAATLSMNVNVVGNNANVEVMVANDFAGHDLPTGVSIRNIVLVVDAIRVEDGLRLNETLGQQVHPLGGIGDPAQGYYGGLPGKIYGRINQDALGNQGVLFTESVATTSTAIPPLGSDTTNYSFELPTGGGIVEIQARMIYRRAWRPLVDAKGWVNEGTGTKNFGVPVPPAPLEDLMAPHYGHLMEEANAAPIDLGPFSGGPQFLRGDADGNGMVSGLTDALRILGFQFLGQAAPPCLEAADVDNNGTFNGLNDALYLLIFFFNGGPAPGAPYPDCAPDPDPGTSIGCDTGCP